MSQTKITKKKKQKRILKSVSFYSGATRTQVSIECLITYKTKKKEDEGF